MFCIAEIYFFFILYGYKEKFTLLELFETSLIQIIMKQNLLKLMLLVISLLTSFGVFAYDFKVDGISYNILSLTERTVYVSGITSSGDVVIPESVVYNNYSFSVDSLGLLFGSTRTKSIKFSKRINTNGHVLYGCVTAYFYVDSSNPYMTTVDGVLYSKDMKRLICYPSYKTGSEFQIPISVISIDDYSFGANCYIRKLSFNDNIVDLPENFLYGNRYSESGGVTYLKLSNKIKVIHGRCLYDLSSIKEIILPKDLEEVEKDPDWSYYGLPTEITNITIYNSNIVNYKYKLNPSVHVFSRFNSLNNFYVYDSNPVPLNEGIFNDGKYFTINLYVPKGTKSKYQELDGWKNFYNIVEVDNDGNIYNDYELLVNVGTRGNVSVQGTNITNGSKIFAIKNGDKVALQFAPNNGCYLKSLIINGEEKVNNVVDNNYTINTFTENTTVVVTFAELPTYLAIKNADNGSVSIVVEKGNAYTTVITPSRGWEVNTVSFNGTDVTSELVGNTYTTPSITEDSEITIVYKQTSVNGVRSSIESLIKVSASHGKVIIENNDKAITTSIYSTNGAMITTQYVGLGTTKISLDNNKIYIIKVGPETFKVAL